MHLVIAKEVAKHLDLDVQRFNLGNLLPDATLDGRNSIAKSKSHFRIEKEPYEVADSEHYQHYDYHKFLEKYHMYMKDDLYLGYFVHLLTDELWIQDIYIKYMRDSNRKKRIDQQANYYHDYDVLNQIILEKYKLKFNIELNEELLKHQITEVENIKLPVMLESLKEYFKTRYENESLLLFNRTDIFDFIEKTSTQIVNTIMEEKLRCVND